MEQGPDELSDREEDREQELDKMTDKPLDHEGGDGDPAPKPNEARRSDG